MYRPPAEWVRDVRCRPAQARRLEVAHVRSPVVWQAQQQRLLAARQVRLVPLRFPVLLYDARALSLSYDTTVPPKACEHCERKIHAFDRPLCSSHSGLALHLARCDCVWPPHADVPLH